MTEERLAELELKVKTYLEYNSKWCELPYDSDDVIQLDGLALLLSEVRKLQGQIQCIESWNELANEKLKAYTECVKRQEKENQALRELLRDARAWIFDSNGKGFHQPELLHRIDAALGEGK